MSNPLFKMKVNGVLGEHTCVLENDRPNGRLASPIDELLVLLSGCTEGIEGRCPARVNLGTAIESREIPDWSAGIVSRFH